EYLSLSAAAQLIGATRGHLANAVLRGEIPSRTLLLGTHGKSYEITKQDAQRVLSERQKWLGVVEAAERAGVGETVMNSMAQAGVVNFDSQWRRDIFKAGAIESSSIDHLHAVLLRKAKAVDKSDGELVFWSELMSRRWGSN